MIHLYFDIWPCKEELKVSNSARYPPAESSHIGLTSFSLSTWHTAWKIASFLNRTSSWAHRSLLKVIGLLDNDQSPWWQMATTNYLAQDGSQHTLPHFCHNSLTKWRDGPQWGRWGGEMGGIFFLSHVSFLISIITSNNSIHFLWGWEPSLSHIQCRFGKQSHESFRACLK